jgi:hypothetical protein
MRKEDQFDPDAIAQALVEREQLEEMREYVIRGRRYKSLEVDQLRAVWIRAFKTSVVSRGGAGTRELNNSWAEFRLRKTEPPYDEVNGERSALVEEIRKVGPDNPRAAQKLKEFLEELRTQPKN